MSLQSVPQHAFLHILQFIGRPLDFMQMLMVCKSWRNQFDENDVDLWYTISVEYDISMSKPNLKRSLRSTTDHRKVFFRTYFEKQREMNERHELLIVQAKTILEGVRDQPAKLAKLIEKCFPNPRYFNPDTHGKTMEDNTLLTLCCRYFQNKCIKMMVNRFSANANIPDVGGFTPLILCAYHGNFAGVLFLLRQKVDLLAVGRLRSGPRLIAEQWAAIQGHMVIFRYLHALRRRTFLSARKQERDRVTSVVSTSALVSAAVTESQQPTCGDSVGGYEDIPIRSETCDNQFNVEDANTTSADELTLPPLFGTTLGLLFTNDELGPEDSNWSALTAATVSASEAPPNLFAVPPTNMSMFIDQSVLSSHDVPLSSTSCEGGRSGVLALATSSSSSSSRGSVVSLCHPADHFCLCQRGYEGQMIACDAASCPVEWYHFECVGLLARPVGQWLCGLCSTAATTCPSSCFTAATNPAGATDPFCICGHEGVGQMVGCENAHCLVEWYHFACVGLTAEPTGHWECPACSGGRFSQPPSPLETSICPVLVPQVGNKRRRRGGRQKTAPAQSGCSPELQKSGRQRVVTPRGGASNSTGLSDDITVSVNVLDVAYVSDESISSAKRSRLSVHV